MSKYIKKDENGFYVFDEIEFLKTLPTGLEYFAVDKETKQIYNLGFNYKEKMEKQIADLEAKLAEVKNSCDYYMKRSNDLVCEIGEYKKHIKFKGKEIVELKQQLAEKEKEYKESVEKILSSRDKLVLEYTQDKISFAVEQLEKFLKSIHSHEKIYLSLNDFKIINGIFDNQIEELKKKKLQKRRFIVNNGNN